MIAIHRDGLVPASTCKIDVAPCVSGTNCLHWQTMFLVKHYDCQWWVYVCITHVCTYFTENCELEVTDASTKVENENGTFSQFFLACSC